MNLTYMNLRNALLGGTITSANLQTLLTSNGAYASAMEAMAGHRSSVDMLTNSETAMSILQMSGRALALMLGKETGYLGTINSPHFLQPGDANTKLRRQAYTTVGTVTWVLPAGGVSDVVAFCVGGGGGGAGGWSSSPNYGGGGGGGQVIAKRRTNVTASQTVTVGVGGAAGGSAAAGGNGGSSSFGSLVTALGGGAGNRGVAGSGGGSTSLGVWFDASVDATQLAWMPNMEIKGGNGGINGSGANASFSYYRNTVDNTRQFIVGAGGVGNSPANGGGRYGGGGGGASGTSRVAPSASTGGGGTGGGASSGDFTGTAGGSGIVVLYWTLA
jgi:hypothetical protein